VVWIEDARGTDTSLVGGKFANLVRLRKAGARVPRGFAVTTFAYRKFMVQLDSRVAPILEGVEAANMDAMEDASRRIADIVEGASIPEDVVRSVAQGYEELAKTEPGGDAPPVAVRSSATAEDMLNASVAGQHESFLWVRGASSVVEHVKKCWGSAFATRSLSYREARGIAQAGVEMGVVVQRMVESKKSGVMFTLNPTNGDPSKITIDATWGLGEAEVSGVVTPDLYLVDKVTMEVLTRKVGRKQVEFVVVGDRVEEKEVPEERRETLCLSDAEVLELAKSGKALEKAFGRAQDIEWALDGSGDASRALHILQARPETVWSAKARAKTESRNALDMVVDTLKRGQKVA
jgi:phosphoenolpyruvate synthase/pyruvate phosphate dikinase